MTKTDWNLIVQGNISLLWCEWSMKPEHQDKPMKDVIEEFRKQFSNVLPLNIGTLLMASYILFVYPQQTEFNAIDFSQIDTSKFVVHQGTSSTETKRFCSRIRNGLTHGRFMVNSNQIELCDQKRDGKDQFRSTISIGAFGDFINKFMHEVKNQHCR